MPIEPAYEAARTVAHIARRWEAADTELLRHLFPLLAEGRPVPVSRLAQVTGKDEETLERALEAGHVDRDAKGRVTELFGLAQTPTRNQVLMDGVALFSCCALVGQMAAPLLGRTVTVSSVDPIANRLVVVVVSPSGLRTVTPREAVGCLAVTDQQEVLSNVRAAFCDHVCLFPSRDAAAEFLAADPHRYLLDPVAFHSIARRLHAAVWQSASAL